MSDNSDMDVMSYFVWGLRLHARRVAFVVAVLCVLGHWPHVFAESLAATELNQGYANELINQSVNTNTLLSSQDLISNGRYVQRRHVDPDTLYETFRLPIEIPLGEPDDIVKPFFSSSAGLLKATGGAADPTGEGADDFSITRLFAVAAGTGAYVRLGKGIYVVPGISLAYTHLRTRNDFNSSYSQTVLAPYGDDFFSWSMDILTYSPAMRLVVEQDIAGGHAKYTTSFVHLLNDSVHSTSDRIDVHSASGLLTNRFELEEPLGITVAGSDTALRPFFQWSNISGKAASGLNVVNLFEVGADFISRLKESFLVFSDIYVGASYVSGDNFEGYHLGVGGHF